MCQVGIALIANAQPMVLHFERQYIYRPHDYIQSYVSSNANECRNLSTAVLLTAISEWYFCNYGCHKHTLLINNNIFVLFIMYKRISLMHKATF